MIVPALGDFRLDTQANTARLGASLAVALRAGEAVCLNGPLGAGKSVLARSLIRTISPGERDVPSPTFTLVQFYQGVRLSVAHFDLYRLTSASEAFENGLDESLVHGAAVIEWAERLGHHLPPDRIDIDLRLDESADNATRRATLTPHGAWEGRAIDL